MHGWPSLREGQDGPLYFLKKDRSSIVYVRKLCQMHDLILLHGAIGSSEQLKPLELKLSANFIVHNLDLPGHGGQEMPPEFNIKFFTSWVSRYCEQRNLKKISVFGYSMGGYVGMYMARQYPSLVNRLATLATKFFKSTQ